VPKDDDGIGYGEFTQLKLEHFEKIVHAHIRVTRAVMLKHKQFYPPGSRYRYIELTAGRGFSPARQKGTPLTFMSVAEAEGVDYRADLIEISSGNCAELERNVELERNAKKWVHGEVEYHNGDYRTESVQLLGQPNGNEMGLIFADPSGDPPDFEILGQLAALRTRMEILIYLSSTNIKRVYQFTGKRLVDGINAVGKGFWLIKNPVDWDKHKWTFLLGASVPIFKDYKRIGFFRLDSARGQEIFEELNLTEQERFESKQPPLL